MSQDPSKAAAATEQKDEGIRLGVRLKRATGGAGGKGGAGGGGGGGQLSATELDELRSSIQKLVGSTNPLGKSMDYLAEDVEDMKAEMRQWRAEYKRRGAWRREERGRGGEGR